MGTITEKPRNPKPEKSFANAEARIEARTTRASFTPSPELQALLNRPQTNGTSRTAKRLGSRVADVLDSIIFTLNVPSDFHRLILFLFAYSKGLDSFDAYRAEVADAFFSEADTDTHEQRKRAGNAREQRFSKVWKEFEDWQRLNQCSLILYYPGTKFGEQSERGRYNLKPLLDLYARVYAESRTTSAFADTRARKLKEVTERIILDEFESLPLPRKRQPKSMRRDDRVKREQSIICSRTQKLVAQLSEKELTEFGHRLFGLIPVDFISLPDSKEGAIEKSEPLLYQNQPADTENKALSGKLDALVEEIPLANSTGLKAEQRPVNQTIGEPLEAFLARLPADGEPTPRQVRTLKLFRVFEPGLSFAEASERIAELKASGAEPLATDTQRAALARAGVDSASLTIREASERISQLYAEGAFLPGEWLSLSELRAFDPKARQVGTKQRYCCPMCSEGRAKSKQRCLRVNLSKNRYSCFHCGTWGYLKEAFTAAVIIPARQFPALPKPEPTREEIENENRWRKWVEQAMPIQTSKPGNGAEYLASRGIPADVADVAGVRFGAWWRRNDEANKPESFAAVIFPIVNQSGELVAAQARAIVGSDKRTRGDKSQGVFLATPGALDAERLAVCEAPIDALALAACGLDAIALCGTTWPEWLLDTLAGRGVFLAHDADAPGDQAANDLAEALAGQSFVKRLRPRGGKDWGDILEQHGKAAIEAQIDFALGCAEPGAADEWGESE